jgi:hypothetical protein
VRRWTLLVVAALLIGWIGAPAIGAQESTPGLAEARAAAQQATQDYADAQTALGELDLELADLQAERDAAQAEIDSLRDDVASLLVEQYINGGESPAALPADDLNEQATADALLRMVNQHETDTIDAYRAAEARRAAAEEEIQARLADEGIRCWCGCPTAARANPTSPARTSATSSSPRSTAAGWSRCPWTASGS